MKNTFFGILPAILLLTGCNDGDLDIERVDFSESSITGCTNFEDTGLLFKIADNEALILQLESNFLRNRVTADSIESNIPGNSQLYYRFFDNAVTNEYFCNTVPPSTPAVLQEVVATGGVIRALSTPKSDGTGFNHGIVIHGAVLMNDAGERVIENRFPLGTYTTIPPSAAIGAEFSNVIHCNDTLVYKAGTDNTDRGIALVLDLEEGLFRNEETEEDSPIISTIGTEGSRVFFYVFDGEVPDNYFCLEEKPETPVQLARYEAIQGEIAITTTETSDRTGFSHQINFQKMILLNANEERLLGQNANFGTFTITTEGDTP
ncbi:hypothetical protein [Sinomicrobium sp. M5D2P9]